MRKIRLVTASALVVLGLGTAACSSTPRVRPRRQRRIRPRPALPTSTSTSTTAVPSTVDVAPTTIHHDLVRTAHHGCRPDHRSSGPSPQTGTQAHRPAPLRPGRCREEWHAAGRERRVHPHRHRFLLGARTVRTRRAPLRLSAAESFPASARGVGSPVASDAAGLGGGNDQEAIRARRCEDVGEGRLRRPVELTAELLCETSPVDSRDVSNRIS